LNAAPTAGKQPVHVERQAATDARPMRAHAGQEGVFGASVEKRNGLRPDGAGAFIAQA
jgi:hypothetical protein